MTPPRECRAKGLFARQRTPLVHQTEAAECGLACLAMVAGHYGGVVGLAQLRATVRPSGRGLSLAQLVRAARSIGLTPRPVRLEIGALGNLTLPCVLHWDFSHFVVLVEATRSHVTILDPAIGKRRLTLSEAARWFTGVALTLLPNSEFREGRVDRGVNVSAVIGKVVGARRALSAVLVLAIGVELSLVAMPFYLQWVFDQAAPTRDLDLLNLLGIAFLGIAVVHALLTAMRMWAVTRLGVEFNFQWSVNTFARLLRLPLDFFSRRTLGSIGSRFESITAVQKALGSGIAESVVDGMLVLGTLAMMAFFAPNLAVVSVATVLGYAVTRALLQQRLQLATHEAVLSTAKQRTSFLETVRGIQTVRLFGKEEERAVTWSNLLAEQFNAELVVARNVTLAKGVGVLLTNLDRVVVVWLAAHALMRSSMSLGMLVAYLAYREQFVTRSCALIEKIAEWRLLRVHIARVADIVLAAPEQSSVSSADIDALPASVGVHNLAFSYGDNEDPVFRDVSFTVREGECVAITGPSGCGKTTLGKVILGLLEPIAGSVLIGGTDVRKLSLVDRRMLFGTVMQDDTFFAGTILENITFFDPTPEVAWAKECAATCGLADEIERMPMRFYTLVGDMGTSLSGGQRQRLLLARALYRRPRLLLLDEATSQLDTGNERRIGEAVAKLKMTRIVIAHRPETVALCDREIQLRPGAEQIRQNEPSMGVA